jgi:3-deoxy-D-manno-octulosonic-acid transferase
MYCIYSFVLALTLLAGSPYFLYQALRHRKYVGSLRQRFGLLPLSLNVDAEPSIWLHAVSVGEVLAVRPLAAALRAQYPALRVIVSTTTVAGQQVARRTIQDADAVFYYPFDFAWIVRRVLDVVNPRVFVTVENEIWPRMLRECARRGVRTAIVNGRISARSFPRYRLARPFFTRVLADVGLFCMQGEESAQRIVAMGADASRVVVTGSLKFDAAALPAAAARGRDRVLRFFRLGPDRPVVVAGSTMRGEEIVVLRAFRRIKSSSPNALLVLAPRHAERFAEAAHLSRGEGFATTRRSELPIDAEPRVDVVVLDTIGELAQIYQLATVAFVGGSLVPTGGHNILEPAVFGRPIVFGPYMSNFAEIAREFLEHHAAVQVAGDAALEQTLVDLLHDPVRRASLGAAARALVDANRGSRDRTIDALARVLPPPRPATVHPFRVVH